MATILLGASACIFIAVGLVVYNSRGLLLSVPTAKVSEKVIAPLLRRLSKLTSEYEELLADLFIRNKNPKTVAVLHLLRHVIVFLLGLIFLNFLFAAGLMVLVHFAPKQVVQYLRRKRWEQFDEQIAQATNVLASSVRSGLTIVQALDSVVTNMPSPTNQEFRLIVSEYNHGKPLVEVMERARTRIPSPNFNIVSTALVVSREKGGNLREVLENISNAISEITRLEKKIKTETSSVRFSANIMMFMPAVMAAFFYMIDPDSVRSLFTTFLGNIILLCVIVLNIVAYVVIQKIVNVEL